jgi:anti-sigma regulatory factor (Ser/Thr protein kinase)
MPFHATEQRVAARHSGSTPPDVTLTGNSTITPTRPARSSRSTRTSRVAASPDAALCAREWIFAQLREAGWRDSALADVALAVDEAVQNAVEHGSMPDAEIRIDLTVRGDVAEVRVRDRGRPGAVSPTDEPRPPGEHSIRGRGRLIMSNLADVDWRPADGGGTEVRLHFCADDDPDLQGPAEGGAAA